MNRILVIVILVSFLFASCRSEPGKRVLKASQAFGAEKSEPYSITDYKNRITEGKIPEWVSLWLEEGANGVEALDAYEGHYVFVSRNEGHNLNALTQWAEGFSAELDFPRLAAARIEARFISAAPLPDDEYGSFFEALVRAASDAPWNGARREDDFWLRRKYFADEQTPVSPDFQPIGSPAAGFLPAREIWEFLILVTIEKRLFATQLDAVFRGVKPSPPPTREQNSAANRVKDRFFDGF